MLILSPFHHSLHHCDSALHTVRCFSALSTCCVDGVLIFLTRLAAAAPVMHYYDNIDESESFINALLKLCLPLKVTNHSTSQALVKTNHSTSQLKL